MGVITPAADLELGKAVVRIIDGERYRFWVTYLGNNLTSENAGSADMKETRRIGLSFYSRDILNAIYNHEEMDNPFALVGNMLDEDADGADNTGEQGDATQARVPPQFEVTAHISEFLPEAPLEDVGFDRKTLLEACRLIKPGTMVKRHVGEATSLDTVTGVAFGVFGPIGISFASAPDEWRSMEELDLTVRGPTGRAVARFNGLRGMEC
ncbi:MAG: hypothetical protein AB7G06_07300 [Bdellovibrionales bacterium]